MQKPFTGALLGILIGLATAIYLARQGIWPADQLTVFFLPGILGLLGMLLLSMGRTSKGPFTLVLALLLAVPMTLWGALGFASLNEVGELNGGCTVSATSAADTTTVTDTSRQDPFVIDPEGGLSWTATSPEAFQDYDWAIEVYLGGIPVPIESGTEANDAGDLENGGDVGNVAEYADSRGIDLDLYRGVYKVGGYAATCDGFGFVEITGEGTDLIALIALIVAITLLIILLVLTFWRRSPVASDTEVGGGDGTTSDPDANPGPAADIAAGALVSGYSREEGGPKDLETEITQEDANEITDAMNVSDRGQEPPAPRSDSGPEEPPPVAETPEPPEDPDKLPGLDG